MKRNLMTSVTVCISLLFFSAGAVLAANPHNSPAFTGTKGQPGTTNGITCNQTVGPGPGGSANGNGSPFNPAVTPPYAGNPDNPTAPGGVGSPLGTSVSQYDVACFQAP